MIYDCFTFFNELELLELRLHELSEVVDKFVLVESDRTFTNQPKPLHFGENRVRFAAFENKIIQVVVKDSPANGDAWTVERFQRNAIARGLTDCCPNDWVLVSDVDEIPRASAVATMSRKIPFRDNVFAKAMHATLNSKPFKAIFHRKGFRRRLRKNHPFVWKFEQSLHRYFLNCVSVKPAVWRGTSMVRYRDFSCAEEIRHSGYKIVPNAGWHFTYMGGVEKIQAKIAAYAHQEFNQPQFTGTEVIEQRIETGTALFGQDEQLEFVPLNDSLPAFVREHPEKFASWIKPV